MKFSEHPRFLAYMELRASGNLPGAIEELEALLGGAELMSAAHRAYLLQASGSLLAEAGHILRARSSFLQAEQADPESLLVLLGYARILGETRGDSVAAVAKCDELVAIANRRPFDETEGDYSSVQYIERAMTLRARFITDGGGVDRSVPSAWS